MTKLIRARSNGGNVVHLVEAGPTGKIPRPQSEAICGYKPSGRRGRWVNQYADDSPVDDDRWCKACRQREGKHA